MKKIIHNTVLAFFIIAYSIGTLGPGMILAVDINVNETGKDYSEKYNFEEITNLIFPYTAITENFSSSAVPAPYDSKEESHVQYMVAKVLSGITYQNAVNYIRGSVDISIPLYVRNVIFPFHYFF